MKDSLGTYERILYHQVHPLKLATDVSVAILSTFLLWRHRLLPALLVAFVPPAVASALLIRRANLLPIANSAIGSYLSRYMTREVMALRLLCAFIMMAGGWYRRPGLIVGAVLGVLACWFYGLVPSVRRNAA